MSSSAVYREREAKLTPPAAFTMPSLADCAAGVVESFGPEQRLVTVYWDTADLRLIRWGCSLRHRRTEGWTVKLPVEGHSAALVRDEHLFPAGTRPPAPALDLLLAYLRGAPVAPIARMVTIRNPVRLHDGEARLLAELADDHVSIFRGRRLYRRFRELEVELADGGSEELLANVIGRLQSSGAGPVDPTPKLVRALGDRAVPAPEVIAGPVNRRSTAGDAVRRTLSLSVIRLLRHDPGIRAGGDPEDVHQARVATRRLRSDLRTFAPLLDPGTVSALREELRWLGSELGAVRDAEVLAARLRRTIQTLPVLDQDRGLRIVAELDAEFVAARARLLGVLRLPRYVALLDRIVEATRLPVLWDGPAAEILPAMVAPNWRRLRRRARRLDQDSPDHELHALRIRAKRCRYAAEAVAPVAGRQAARFARRVAALQEVLGDHQDAVVAEAWLRRHRAAGRGVAYVAGELSGLELAAGRIARQLWPQAWKRVNHLRTTSWIGS